MGLSQQSVQQEYSIPLASIGRKMAWAYGSVIVVLLFVLLLVDTVYYYKVSEQEQNVLVVTLGSTLQDSVSRVSFSGKYHVRLLLEDIAAKNPAISYLMVLDKEGRVDAHSDPGFNEKVLDDIATQHAMQALSSSEPVLQSWVRYGQKVKEVALPYVGGYGNEVKGIIRIGIYEDEHEIAFNIGILYLSGFIVFVSLIAIGFVYRLSVIFSKPVKKAADALQESQRTLSTLLSNLPGMVYRYEPLEDKQWHIAFVSEGCEALSGYSQYYFIDQPLEKFTKLIYVKDCCTQSILSKQLSPIQPSYEATYRIHHANGQECWVWEQGQGIFDEQEKLIALEGFITDISAAKQAENALIEARQEAESANRLKDEFLANTSHELRTPLNGIIGIADSLLAGAAGTLNPQVTNNLSIIAASGSRLANLVNNILDFSKLQHHKLYLQIKAVDLHALVDLVLTLTQPLSANKKLQLHNDIEPALPLAAADEERLQQVLYNLIGNAIKFTDQGEVHISAALVERDNKKELLVQVKDTGIGIKQEFLERIFESFEQGDGSTARQYGGTGLGLAISRQLIQLHGGNIEVSSTPGQGSCFSFNLPIFDAELSQALVQEPQLLIVESAKPRITTKMTPSTYKLADIEASDASSTNHGELILIVDDEPVNHLVLVNNLSLYDYRILQASSGQEALDIIQRGILPDLILLDVMMPRMTGYEVTQILRKDYDAGELPILLLSAKNQTEDLVIGLEAGANDYIAKPIAKDELLARIRTHLRVRRLRSENNRLSAEINITRRLQHMILPTEAELQNVQGLDIACFMESADEVGGDYYDVLQQGERVRIGFGDVTGHGLESGVLMLMVQMAMRTLLTQGTTEPKTCLEIINRAIYANTQRMRTDRNLTLLILDYERGQVSLSGQHEEVLIVRKNGQVECLDTLYFGFMVGLKADISELTQQYELQLEPGDGLVLYTDGITEAFDEQGNLYGTERLCAVISQHWQQQNAAMVKQAVLDDVHRHMGKRQPLDDLSLMILRRYN